MNLKKPKFWDYKKPNLYAYLLIPFAYVLKILNLFKKKTNKKQTNLKTICVGNIYIGGTGKTSLSIKINEILNKKKIKSCFIKKFYKDQIDEQKFLESRGKLFLSSKRIDAINQAKNENYEVAILDDGLQDNSVNHNLSFVCFNNINWIGNGLTIPAGPLREGINSLKKYQHVFLNGNLENIKIIEKQIFDINPKIEIHVGKYVPLNLHEFASHNKYLVFSGIGNHQTFISMIKEYGLNIHKDIEFPDHYTYSKFDVSRILTEANNSNCKIITTEKDYLRLDNNNHSEIKFIKTELQIVDEERLINTII